MRVEQTALVSSAGAGPLTPRPGCMTPRGCRLCVSYVASTVGDLVGSLNHNRYRSMPKGVKGCACEATVRQSFGEYLVLPSDIGEAAHQRRGDVVTQEITAHWVLSTIAAEEPDHPLGFIMTPLQRPDSKE